MSRIGARLRHMNTKVVFTDDLLDIRIGSGALRLPQDVFRIHLKFAPKMDLGHMGPRKFWHHSLIRLKYHNPGVSMTVDRTLKQEEDPTLTIHFTDNAATKRSTDNASEPSSSETTKSAVLKWKTEADIVRELMALTKATEILPTADDKQQLERISEENSRAQVDRERCLAVRAEVKRQQKLLEEARAMTS